MTAETTRRRALIVTGEASGDLHGANLIRAAREVDPQLSFFGVGGPGMAREGCEILIPAEELAVMGLVEVVGHLPVIWRAFSRLKRILQGPERPGLVILIDFAEFNLRLAKVAHKAGVPVLYYVSPQVWAWRRGRIKKIARVVDRLAAVFPFEPELYRGENIEVEYVGHPLLDETGVSRSREMFQREHGLEGDEPVVGLFPGSRRSELRYIFDTILDAAALIRRQKPDVRFLLPVAPTLEPSLFRERLAGRELPVTLVQESLYDTANACDAVMTVSGTATLQTALVGTPMAILYKMSPITYALARLLVRVDHIGLANIVAGKRVVQEFIQGGATPENLAGEILRILDDAPYRQSIRRELDQVRQRMGQAGCSLRVARMVSEMSRQEKR